MGAYFYVRHARRLQAVGRNSGATAILEQGLKWQPPGMPIADRRFIGSRNCQVRDAARAFDVPTYKLAIAGLPNVEHGETVRQPVNMAPLGWAPMAVGRAGGRGSNQTGITGARDAAVATVGRSGLLCYDASRLPAWNRNQAMPDTAADMESASIVIEFDGVDEAAADDLRKIFDGEDEDVAFSHAFGGADTVAIVTSFAKGAFAKLVDYFAATKTNPSKTKLRIGRGVIEMDGFSRQDIEALFASPRFQQFVKAARPSRSASSN